MRAQPTTVADPAGVYDTLVAPGVEPEQVGQGIFELSRVLADATRADLPDDATVLCVIVLRGGLLLCPGFAPPSLTPISLSSACNATNRAEPTAGT
ncbi:hypothetical protein ACGFY7_49565 [Streptomyces prunicolor]|uniref:hypothetical protein n=1 Tax=Streptomyces prunicolor TaxID=67348 RepID=UPI00371F7BCF